MNWQPIETAPRDGTSILIFQPKRNEFFVSAWMEHDIEWWHVFDGKFDPRPVRGPDPSHWQPLPEPPTD